MNKYTKDADFWCCHNFFSSKFDIFVTYNNFIDGRKKIIQTFVMLIQAFRTKNQILDQTLSLTHQSFVPHPIKIKDTIYNILSVKCISYVPLRHLQKYFSYELDYLRNSLILTFNDQINPEGQARLFILQNKKLEIMDHDLIAVLSYQNYLNIDHLG